MTCLPGGHTVSHCKRTRLVLVSSSQQKSILLSIRASAYEGEFFAQHCPGVTAWLFPRPSRILMQWAAIGSEAFFLIPPGEATPSSGTELSLHSPMRQGRHKVATFPVRKGKIRGVGKGGLVGHSCTAFCFYKAIHSLGFPGRFTQDKTRV